MQQSLLRLIQADVGGRVAGRLEDVPGAERRRNLHPAVELVEGGQRGEREVGLLAGVGVLVDHVLGHALGARPALTRGVDPLRLERAVGEGLVRGVHPHRAAALRHDPCSPGRSGPSGRG